MIYEWDDEKNESNFKKHGVWFEEARTVWADPLAMEFNDEEHSEIEDRFLKLGYTSGGTVLMIVFCEKEDGDVIRIISARPATFSEERVYVGEGLGL